MGKRKHQLSALNLVEKTAICSFCGPVKIRVRPKGDSPRCFNALREEESNYFKKNPDRSIGRRWKDHGVNFTVEEYRDLFEKQSGLCAICKKSSKINLAVDHCHETGRVRGLLCTRCNLGLGCFSDDPEQLKIAISYLSF